MSMLTGENPAILVFGKGITDEEKIHHRLPIHSLQKLATNP
jgi:hypothetical protein